MSRRILIGLLAVAVVSFLPGKAATPSSGTLSPTISKLTYRGETGVGAPLSIGGTKTCVEGATCDTFDLTIDVPETFYDSASRVLTATITWADEANDLDLYLCGGSTAEDPQCLTGQMTSSESTSNVETVTVTDPAPGAYRLVTKAYAGTSPYDAVVTFLAPPPLVLGLPKGVAAKPLVSQASSGFSWDSHPVNENSGFAEPSIDVDHSNVIYVTAPGGAGVQVWRSIDGGKTFQAREVGAPQGGGDSEIEILSNDVVLTADLEITDSAVSRSDDRLASFTQQPVGIEQDRQWLAHRCSNLVLLGYHDFILEAEMVSRSTDGGLTWEQIPVFISPKGSAPGAQDLQDYADQGVNTFSGPIVVDQKTGDAYIIWSISSAVGNVATGTPPFGEPEQIMVGVSHDEGLTWSVKKVKSGGVGALAGNIFPWITLDRAGNVYASWAGRDKATDPINVYMAYSNDHGETWSTPYRVNRDVGPGHLYTTMSAGDPGVVDIAWYTGTKPDPNDTDQDWYVDFAQVRNANTGSPQITQSRVMPNRIHHGSICLEGILCVGALGGDRSLLDFFQIQIGPDGMANIAFANNGSPDDTLRVWYARQTGGRSAGSALHDSKYCAKAAGGPGPLINPQLPPLPGKLPPKKPRVLGGHLAGTGVGGAPLVAWVLLASAAAVAGRFRPWRSRA